MSTITKGTEFTRRDARPYTLDSGEKGVHEHVLLCRVVALTEVGFDWERVEVLSESGRPATFTPAAPADGGSMAWFGFEAALNRGDIEVIANA